MGWIKPRVMIPERLVRKFFFNPGSFEYIVTLEGGMKIDGRGLAHQHCVGTDENVSYLTFSFPDAYRALSSFWVGKSELLGEEEFNMFLQKVPELKRRILKTGRDFFDGELLRDSENLQRLLGYQDELERVLGRYDWRVK